MYANVVDEKGKPLTSADRQSGLVKADELEAEQIRKEFRKAGRQIPILPKGHGVTLAPCYFSISVLNW